MPTGGSPPRHLLGQFSHLATTIGILGLVAGATLIAILLLNRSIHFSLDKHRIAPGGTFTLTSTFHNIWRDYIRPGGQVSIMDEKGTDWLVSTAQRRPGGIVNISRGEDAVATGCRTWGIPTRPPVLSSRKETFLVLPETPPGKYTVRVPPNRFCHEEAANAATALEIEVR